MFCTEYICLVTFFLKRTDNLSFIKKFLIRYNLLFLHILVVICWFGFSDNASIKPFEEPTDDFVNLCLENRKQMSNDDQYRHLIISDSKFHIFCVQQLFSITPKYFMVKIIIIS